MHNEYNLHAFCPCKHFLYSVIKEKWNNTDTIGNCLKQTCLEIANLNNLVIAIESIEVKDLKTILFGKQSDSI